ncbi:MAG: formylmethanofuran dehydrogenase subunit E family protein [Methanomassiliicoccales archaeon]|nr:formylmethanofuran dehydrogenase subunit E family protein [Methanomassiliicoccales archaeon]
MAELPDDLRRLADFHGHLGAYVLLGYRMGLVARKYFPGKFYATLFTGTEPPISCLIDGVQFSSRCTLGKGNLAVKEGGRPNARFYDGIRSLEMSPLDAIQRRIDAVNSYEAGEKLSLELHQLSDLELLLVRECGREASDRIVKL